MKVNWIIKIFERFSEFVMALKADKWWHIGLGLAIYVFCMLKLPIESENWLFGVSWLITTFAGAFKEIVIDKWCKLGTPDKNDFYATIAIPTFITLCQFVAVWIQS